MTNERVLSRLRTLRERNKKNPLARNKDLYKLLASEDFIGAAYQSIKSKYGNRTPGTDGETLDEYSKEIVQKVVTALKDQSWQFKPVRRKYIPKANGKLRPLGIPSPRDKVIQQGISMILTSIYEPVFLECSHGFRPNKSCHSALRDVRTKWSGIKWVIEGDIEGCYDNVDHHILVTILRKRIQDERFLNLIWKILRAGIEEDGKLKTSRLGCPQGGVVSPILANIYLHELDCFVRDLAKNARGSISRKPNKVYEKLRGKRDRLRFYRDKNGKTLPRPKSEINTYEVRKITKEMRKIPSKEPMDPNFTKILYIRYADDWIIGIIGPKSIAEEIREKLEIFLSQNLHLKLSKEKTNISHLAEESAHFLGFQIKCGGKGGFSGRSISKDMFGNSKRTVGWQPRLFVPMNKIIKRLSEKNFCNSHGFSQKKKGWILYSDETIIARYNSVLRGLRNYYSPADNLSTSMNRIQFILKYSCAHTLAAKHRTRISVQLQRKDTTSIKALFDQRPCKINPWDFKGTKVNESSLEKAFKSFAARTNVLTSSACMTCGATEKLEMHHVRALRKGGVLLKDKYMIGMMQRLNRKQITVCRKCHTEIHKGKYDGDSLKFL